MTDHDPNALRERELREWLGNKVTHGPRDYAFRAGWDRAWAKANEVAEESIRELTAEVEQIDGRRREGRQLLRRFVKYAREDRAVTPRWTRLERLTAQVDDYLRRTEDPNDILRAAPPAAPAAEPDPLIRVCEEREQLKAQLASLRQLHDTDAQTCREALERVDELTAERDTLKARVEELEQKLSDLSDDWTDVDHRATRAETQLQSVLLELKRFAERAVQQSEACGVKLP